MTDEQFKEIKEEFMAARKLQWAIYFLMVIVMCTQKCKAQDSSDMRGLDTVKYQTGDTIYFRKDIITRNDSAFLNGELIAGLYPFPDTVPWKPYYKPKKKKKAKYFLQDDGTWMSDKDTIYGGKFLRSEGDFRPVDSIGLSSNTIQGGTNITITGDSGYVFGAWNGLNASDLPIAQPKQDPWYDKRWFACFIGFWTGIACAIFAISMRK